jgi:hypothetical protein
MADGSIIPIAPLKYLCGISRRFYVKNRAISGHSQLPKTPKLTTFNTSFRRSDCPSLAGRFGGIALVTSMRDVQPGVD